MKERIYQVLEAVRTSSNHRLFKAICEGDKDKVIYYLENHVYKKDEINIYLRNAIQCHNLEIIKLLLEYGATITPCTMPLFAYTHEDILKLLLTHCSAYCIHEYRWSGKTYLHLAVEAQFTDVVVLLIERGADVNAKTNENESVIQLAFQANNEKIIHLLLQCDIDLSAQDFFGNTPLHYAVNFLNISIIQKVLNKGANVNIRNKDGMTPLDFMITKYDFSLARKTIEWMNKMSPGITFNCAEICQEELYVNDTIKNKLIDAVKILLENGSKINSCCTNSKLTPLHHAVKSGNREMVVFFVQNNANINAIGARDETPLNIAIAYEHEEIAKYLISKGAIVNHGFNDDMLLHMAVFNKNEKLVNLLLENNADITVKYKEDGRTALHLAVTCECSKITEIILNKGANINESTNTGDTAFHIATKLGFLNICKILLKHKPNINQKNSFGQTPLYIAVEKGFFDIVTELLHKKPDITKNKLALYFAVGDTDNHRRIAVELISYGFSFDFIYTISFEEIISFVNKAVINGHLKILRCLLNFGLDLNLLVSSQVQNNERFFLHAAIKKSYMIITKLLIDHGIDVNMTDEDNCTPIFYAAASNNFNIVNLLLENYAKVDNYQIFFMVISKANYRMIQHFLKYYKNVNVQDEFGTTALHIAVWNGDEETIQLLFEKGCKYSIVQDLPHFTEEMRLRIQDHYGKDVLEDFRKNIVTTPLHIAARRNYSDIVEALIEHGFNVDCRDSCERTPLHIASLFNNLEVIDVLIEFGADLKAVDDLGKTCIDYAYNSSLFQSRLYLDKVFAFIYNVDIIKYEGVRPLGVLSLRLQMKYLAILNSKKEIVEDQAVNSYQWQELYDSCCIEIKKLKEINILNNITMYDVLTKDIDILALYLKNENFNNEFDLRMATNKLQFYGKILNKRIRRAKEKKFLLDETEIYFTSILGMPNLIAHNIMTFLSNRDLRCVKLTYELFFRQFDCIKCKEE
ncbi:ankyrin-1-like [Phymastichus coffea]|uniref:ankyrin-1-like n=1 Tax=Phymastichus coffea TaxID=108790 RepID=UPI00273BD6D2|nr:ankyrin-1-like [Phymastichus coffea]